MFGLATRRTSIRRRITGAAGAALLLMTMGGWFTPVAGASPLSITNSDSPDPVQSGSQILYTIVITNTGGAKVSNAVLTDQYNGLVGFGNPPLLDAVSTRGSCTQNNTQVTCNGGTIEGGGVWTVTIRGVVSAAGGTTINNNATVTGTKSAQTFTNSASATTQVQGTLPGGQSPDLTINKNGPLSAAAGGPITYTMTVNNLGNAGATGIKVTDNVPGDISALSVSATSLFQCGFAGHALTCTGGQVNAGANGTITVHGTVSGPGPLVNTAVVDPDNTIDEGVLGDTQDFAERNNNSNTVTTNVSPIPPPPAPPITIDKIRIGGSGQAVPGELIDYQITITNGPLGRADYITMTDTTQGLQAASLTVLSATSESGTTPQCVVSAPIVTCTMTRLATGSHMVVKIRGMVVASAGSTIINNATVNANIKNAGYTATDQVQTIIKPGFDLTITKSDTPDPVCASSFPPPGPPGVCQGGLRYDFTLGNSGIAPVNDVVVRDVIPAGTQYDDSSSSPECDEQPGPGSGVVVCLVDVGAESTTDFHIVVVAPGVTGSITNTVNVDPANAIFESDETNNVATQTTQVSTGIDLTIVKDDETNDGPPDTGTDFNQVNSLPGFDPIATSGTQTYTIIVDNIGTQDVVDIRVRDTLPAGTRFLSVTADHDFTCVHNGAPTGGVVECTGGDIHGTKWESYVPDSGPGPNGPDFATIIIKAFARPEVGIMINEVRVDPLNEVPEANETNNIDTETTTVINGDSGTGAFNELSITKHSAPETTVSTSTPVTYTIRVTNTGTDPAVNVVVRDTLPVGFVLISAFDTVPGPLAFLCAPGGGNVVDCNGATIMPGALNFREITITAFSAAQPGNYTNQAIVDPLNAIPEGNETNNAASDPITVVVGAGFIDLTIKKCDVPIVAGCQPPAAAAVKDTDGLFEYFIEVRNNGTDPAFNVVARDVLPPNVTFLSVTDDTDAPGDFICVHMSGTVTCTGGTLDGSNNLIPDDPATLTENEDVPQSRSIRILVRAPHEHGVVISNQAFVDPGNAIPESNETNNQAFEVTSIQSPFNLVLDKEGPDQAHQNDEEDYEITVTNEGPAVNDVVVVDALPIGLIPLSVTATPSNFICDFTENPVNGIRCVGDMGATGTPEATVKITIHVFVTQNGGPLDNEACVDPDNNVIENKEFDNCDTKTTDIVHFSPNLSVQKSGPSTASAGETITYTVTVSNIGDAPADEPVTITDALPDAVTFVGVNASNGFECTHDGSATGGDITCTDPSDSDTTGLDVGSFTTITIQATVNADVTAPFTNTASVPDGTAFDEDSTLCDVDPTPCEAETSAHNNNNSDSVTTSISGSAIDLVMGDITDQFDPVNIGDSLVYTFTVSNGGSQDALAAEGHEVVIRVDMPTVGVDFQSGIASQGFICTATNSDALLTCTGDLDAGEFTTVTVTFDVTAATPPKLSIHAKVDPDDDIVEISEANNEAFEDTTVNTAACNSCIDLVMGQIYASPNPVTNGEQTTYSFTVTNIGDLPTEADTDPDDVEIRIDLDTIFDDSSFVSFTATNDFTCSQPFLLDLTPSTDILCKNTTTGLAAGAGTLITITVDVDTAFSLPTFLDFDVDVDPENKIDEGTFEFNNEGGLRIDIVAP